MQLETLSYYRLPRNDDGRMEIHPNANHAFVMALRWQPEIPEDGAKHLKTLQHGGEIAKRHLDLGLRWLYEGLQYYKAAPEEPYPGRNVEAMEDLRRLYEELHQTNSHVPADE